MCRRDLTDREDGAGRTDHGLPADAPVFLLDRLEFLARCNLGRAHACLSYEPFFEKPLAQADTAHVQTLHSAWIEMPAENKLGTTASDVDNQTPFRPVLQAMRYAEVNETRLFVTGNDVNTVAEGRFRLANEIVGFAQRVGTDDPDAPSRQIADALAELLKAIEGAFDGLLSDGVVRVQATAYGDHAPHAADDLEVVRFCSSDD